MIIKLINDIYPYAQFAMVVLLVVYFSIGIVDRFRR